MVLEDRVQPDHHHLIPDARVHPFRQRYAVAHAPRAEHLEGLDHDHLAAESAEGPGRRLRPQPLAHIPLGGRTHDGQPMHVATVAAKRCEGPTHDVGGPG